MDKRPSTKRLIGLLLVTLLCQIALLQASRTIDTATFTASYTAPTRPLELDKIMNASQGGYQTLTNSHWLPSYYDAFAEAGLRMIRLDHVFDEPFYNPVTRRADGQLSYDFSRLDATILPLVQRGMVPLISLSYTPAALGATPVNVPQRLDDWQALVRAMVEHYVALGYTGWYWEVWNEPDNPDFWHSSASDYTALYAATARAVKQADQRAHVGGPAASHVKAALMIALLNDIQAHPDVPLDFVAWHDYATPDFSSTTIVKAELTSRGLWPKPLFITEWNTTVTMQSGAGSVTDTNESAAYAAKRLFSALMNPDIARVFYFTPAEGLTPSQAFSGDLGLLTVQGHRKAVFNTFAMYHRLQPHVLASTMHGVNTTNLERYGIATKDDTSRTVNVLLWNNTAEATQINVELRNLPYQTTGEQIKLTKQVIDADHGNSYADAKVGIRGVWPSPHEMPDPVEMRVLPGSEQLFRSEVVLPFSVVLLTLEATRQAPGNLPLPKTPFVTNLAVGRTVMSSSSDEQSGWTSAQLTDEVRHSFVSSNNGPALPGWRSGVPHPDAQHAEWVTVDLGQATTFNHIKLCPYDARDNDGRGFPVDFAIEGAANAAGPWTTLTSFANYQRSQPVTGPQTFDVPPTTYRYVRLYATRLSSVQEDAAVYRLQLAEFEVYDTR